MVQKSVFVEGLFTLRNLRSIGTAAILEVLIAAGVAGILIWQHVRPGDTAGPRTPPIVIPDDPPPLPRTIPTPQQPEPEQLHPVPAVPVPFPTPDAVRPLPELPPLVPEHRAHPPADLAIGFSAGMLEAINAQKVYPRTSLLKAETGETVVSFDYVDGVVSNIHVDRSSGSRELDQAAVEAVRKATLPSKPAELAGLRHFVFTLVFNLD
ncbi:MAG TPA: TonB family protein [Gammaproteobacteria bacterium]